MRESDISSRSLSIIESSVQRYLNDNIIIPEWRDMAHAVPTRRCSKVLLTGLFYQKVFELDDWPKENFFLYCLSPSVKNILTQLLQFDEDTITTIPRYDLFPLSSPQLPFPSTNSFHLIHAGRISPQKNIEFLIFVTFYFQIFLSPSIELTLMGNIDNDHHRHAKGIRISNYIDTIQNLISSLPWIGKKPSIINQLGANEWIKKFPANGVFFSASNLISEDFSVSLAQVQNDLGSPCLLPYWGAFKDATGENIRFYSVDNLGASYETFSQISIQAKRFVLKYIKGELFLNPEAIPSPEYNKPKMINQDYLLERILLNKKKWGNEIDHIVKGNFHLFAKSDTGQAFFNAYSNIFKK